MIQERHSLAELTSREVERYAGYSDESNLYFLSNDMNRVYTVVDIPHTPRTYSTEIVVMAHVVNDQIVIDEDTTDKPLFEALMVNAHIPRENIILAYQGETVPVEVSKTS
jgi:hypothetical protein